jgi:hypothetical protein
MYRDVQVYRKAGRREGPPATFVLPCTAQRHGDTEKNLTTKDHEDMEKGFEKLEKKILN